MGNYFTGKARPGQTGEAAAMKATVDELPPITTSLSPAVAAEDVRIKIL